MVAVTVASRPSSRLATRRSSWWSVPTLRCTTRSCTICWTQLGKLAKPVTAVGWILRYVTACDMVSLGWWRAVPCFLTESAGWQEDKVRGIFVKGLQQIVVESAEKLEALMVQGNSVRHQAATQMNDRSSRSHSIFCIRIQQRDADNEQHNVFAKVLATPADTHLKAACGTHLVVVCMCRSTWWIWLALSAPRRRKQAAQRCVRVRTSTSPSRRWAW